MKNVLLFLALTGLSTIGWSQVESDPSLPVRGLCIAAPKAGDLPRFLNFVEQELASRQVNTLILRINFNYQFESHPELADENALSKKQVKAVVDICKKHDIRLIPLVNLLGHQSWAGSLGKLLSVYPQFDETPHIELPEEYKWPNEDGLYCKSYCPLHPEVHAIVFDIVDEICTAFESDAFHAGMDEVFYLGDDKCPRCSGRDKAELFAGEVSKIQQHLASKERELWIWGDRLIDGKTTGIGMWEASFNNTHRAIDMIPKSVVICDWHYEKPHPTAVYFAMKGFGVVSCPWRTAGVGTAQVEDMRRFRHHSSPEMKERFLGILQTVWSDASSFMDEFYGIKKNEEAGDKTPSHCFRATFEALRP